MTMKKKILTTLSVVLILGLAAMGILAYLTSTDSDVNVMTLGNVKIDQVEQERIDTTGDASANNLREFTGNKKDENGNEDLNDANGKLLYPLTPGYEENGKDLWNGTKNAVDKLVSVENTGKSEAYVRTWFAFEMGDMTKTEWEAKVKLNINNTDWIWTDGKVEAVDGANYYVMCAVYNKALGTEEGNNTTPYSLKQVALVSEATNEDVEKLDANGDGEYEIRVFSQAVQTAGFDTAMGVTYCADLTELANGNSIVAALNTAFGTDHPWPKTVSTATDVYNSTLESDRFTLGKDITTSDSDKHYSANREYAITSGRDYTLNLNGKTINHDGTYQDGNNTGYTYLYTTAYNGKLTVNGEGNVYSENAEGCTCIFYAQGPSEIVINGGDYHAVRGIPVWAGNNAKVIINGGKFTSSGSNDEELIYSSGGTIEIYDGFFHNEDQDNRPVNVANRNRDTGYIYIYGGTFVNFDPSTGGDDPENILVMEGYKVVSETQSNGDIWYTVVPE